MSPHDEAKMILAFSSFAGFGHKGPFRFVLLFLRTSKTSSIRKMGKEGGNCNFLLFDDQ